MASKTSYKHYNVTTPLEWIAHVEINRQGKMNSFYDEMWLELRVVFDTLSLDPSVRAIVFSGAGDRAFTTGLDVQSARTNPMIVRRRDDERDAARWASAFRRFAAEFQDCVSSIEKCEKPVICVMHGYAFGLAIDIATCADIRLCASDAQFAVKEVDIGLASDIGTLTRLPRVVGSSSWVKDVCLTARTFGAEEALRVGFVSGVLLTKQETMDEGFRMAAVIARKSPVATQGIKEFLNKSRDQTVDESLRYTKIWNAAAVQTDDIAISLESGAKARYDKL